MIKHKEVIKKTKNNNRKKIRRFTVITIFLFFIILLNIIIWQRNNIAKYYLENNLGGMVKANISLDSIDINSKGIYFTDLKVESQTDLYYYLETSKLNIDINYSALFNRKKWLNEIVDSLYVESPTLAYKQKFGINVDKKDKDKKSSFDVRNYLRKATIANANIDAEVKYKEVFGIKDHFSGAELTFDNRREQSLIANLLDNKLNPFQVKLMLDEKGLNSLNLTTNGYSPDSLYVPVAKDLEFGLSGEADLKFASEEGLFLSMNLLSNQAKVNLFDIPLEINHLTISGDSKRLFILPEEVMFMGIPIVVQGDLINLFSNLEIEATAHVDDYQVSETYSFMNGFVNLDVDVNGLAKDLHITGSVNSDSLDFNSLVITNVDAAFDFQEQLEVYLHNVEFNKNIISGHGILQRNYISADMLIKNMEESDITIQGDFLTKGIIIDENPHIRLIIHELMVGYNGFQLSQISGFLNLDKDILNGQLSNDNMLIQLNTDLALTKSETLVSFVDYHVSDTYQVLKQDNFSKLNPLVNGKILLNKDKEDVAAKIDLEITALEDQIYLPIKTDLQWNLSSNIMNIDNSIINGKVYSNKTNLIGHISFDEFKRLDTDIVINNDIIIRGEDLLANNRKFKMQLNQLSLTELKDFFPPQLTKSYPDGFITLDIDYQWSSDLITGDVLITGIEYAGFSGYGLHTCFQGNLEQIFLDKFILYNERQIIVNASGFMQLKDGLKANVNAVINEIDFTDYQNLIPLKGFLMADLNLRYDSKDEEKYSIRMKGVGSDFKINDFDINDVYFNVLYTHQKLHVDNLYMNSFNLADMNIIGDFSYDLFKNEFVPSNERLYVKLDADVYKLLTKLMPNMFEEGKIDLRSELVIGIGEEGLQVFEGYIITEDGYLQILDQPEIISDIDILAVMKNNKLDLSKFELNLGDGYLSIANEISEDNDNFFVGNLILGQFKVFTSQRGILVNIPQYMPKNETALIKLSGKYNKYASIKGPFDDMKIDVEVSISNASIIYPPNTENLLSIVTSASKNTFSRKDKTPKKGKKTNNPLPFKLDAKLIVGENFKYVTYPTDIVVSPNSYLNLTYDNNKWSVPDARFVAEDGTVTFLDTEFDVDLVEIIINEIDLSIAGTFVKRVADGSVVTLRVSNEQSNQVGLDNLVLTLESDNPDDNTQTQAINRLRASSDSYDIEHVEQNALQDETMLMLGSNVDNTFINKFFKPVETFFRKRMKLDYFYIKPGFVKNMVSNYVINDQDNSVNVNQSQTVSDSELAQFSSSILLNNLTLNLGRPIYKGLYFNYEGFFQETTDLDRRSKIIYDQDFQLRTNINFKTKMSYTFKYRPSGTNSHEVMLFHSINF